MNSFSNTYDSSSSVMFTLGVFLMCFCAIASLYWTNNAELLNYFFPFLSIVVGGLLYAARPAMYLGFTLWIWFLTPFIRRIVDYQMGQFSPVSLVMLTPYLVSAFSFFSVIRFGMLLKKPLYRPFLFMMLGVLYGYVVGLAKSGLFAASFNLVEWICPLIIGFHVLVNWRSYPEHRKAIRSTFTFGVIVMGTYGVLQFIMPAPWDTFWMTSSGMTSIGHPEPFRVRVFSTLNAPGPFAMTMMAGLLLMFEGRGVLSKVALFPGYAGFLLAIVRGAWGGWVLGLILMITRMTGRMRERLIGILILGTLLFLALAYYGPDNSGAEVVGKRIESIGKIQEDGSFKHRMAMYQTRARLFLFNPVGEGLGFIGGGSRNAEGQTRNLDSGILGLFAALGWLGTGLYLAGVYVLIQQIRKNRNWYNDQFAIIAFSIGVSYLLLMVLANQVISIKGVIIWTLFSLALSSKKYHELKGVYK